MSLFGSILKGVGGFIAGGPAGAVAAVAGDKLLGGGRRQMPVQRFAPQSRPPIRVGPVGINPRAALPGGRPFVTHQPAPQMNGAGPEGKAPAGWHWNKSDYWLKDGTFVPKGTKLVKNRRRDPLNPTALRSAISRIDAGKRWQGKLREIETGKYTKAGNKKDC